MTRQLFLLVIAMLTATRAGAEVLRVDVVRRAAIEGSGYEKIVGTAHFSIDPAHLRNRAVTDLDKVPVGPDGKVTFSADIYILRPLASSPGNGVALVDVVNRGRKMTLNGFNRGGTIDPQTAADLGDGFLMRQGFTLVWVGWQFDVRRQGGLMSIDVPFAAGVSDMVRAVFVPNDRSPDVTVADLAGYAADEGPATLTVRSGPFGHAETVPHDRWRLNGHVVSMPNGFEPGRTYEVSFRASKIPVAGLGLVALRDVTSWLKYPSASGTAGAVRHAIAFGSSQSGRFLRTFLYDGFNADERDRLVFDGVMAHIAGAGRLSLNTRGATPNALSMFEATMFPYADQALRDPISGRTDGLLDNDRARRHQPKVMYTNTAVEYWGGGRAAALVHTTPDGTADLTLPANVRAYFLTGAQHSPGQFPPRVTQGQQPENPLEYWWTLRALLLAMDRWVREDVAPPASQYPRLADGTLVAARSVAFPRIPRVHAPDVIPAGRQGSVPVPFLVSKVDGDGNEVAGVRVPELAVPLATYTGWNFRAVATGGADQLVSLAGSSIRFATTRAEREKVADPRPSIEERYGSRDAYMRKIEQAADGLVRGGYLLPEDVAAVVARAAQQWGL